MVTRHRTAWMAVSCPFPVLAFLALILASMPRASHAQAPRTFGFQGYLTNSAGQPLTGTYAITFSLYPTASGGTPAWSETQTVSVSRGVFSAALGSVTPLPESVSFQRPYTVGVRVGTDPEMTPRRPVSGVPYALALPGLTTQANAISPNVLGGYAGNAVTPGAVGATISGGGAERDLFSDPAMNRVTDSYGVVGGGYNNRAGDEAGDTASARWATVGGGGGNSAGGESSTVAGGYANVAFGTLAAIGGGNANIGWGYMAAITGGQLNGAGTAAFVGGGVANEAADDYSVIAGGRGNEARGRFSAIGGGGSATETEPGNRTWDDHGAIAGGLSNAAGRDDGDPQAQPYAAVGGGRNNRATGAYAAIPGGGSNEAAGAFSFASGRRSRALHDGSIVLSDGRDADTVSTRENQLTIRATGGARVITGIDAAGNPTSGVALAPGDGAWGTLSDRDAKTAFAPVDPRAILNGVAGLPLATWRYRAQDPSVRHIGPTAQDFSKAFGLGADDRRISTVDADGVALAAIQGLYQLLQEKDARIAALEQQNAAILARLEALEGEGSRQ